MYEITDEMYQIVDDEFYTFATQTLRIDPTIVRQFLADELEHDELYAHYTRLEHNLLHRLYHIELAQVTKEFKKELGI